MKFLKALPRNRLLLLFALTSAAAYLWFTQTGRELATSAGSQLTTGVEKVIDLANSTLQLIAKFERFSPTPYPDARGQSIGYGHFILPGESFTSISEPEGYTLLRSDVRIAADTVKQTVSAPLTQPQFDALASLAYNIGVNAFARSTLVRKLNAGDTTGAANEFPRWNMSQGVVMANLVDRRAQEQQIFMTG